MLSSTGIPVYSQIYLPSLLYISLTTTWLCVTFAWLWSPQAWLKQVIALLVLTTVWLLSDFGPSKVKRVNSNANADCSLTSVWFCTTLVPPRLTAAWLLYDFVQLWSPPRLTAAWLLSDYCMTLVSPRLTAAWLHSDYCMTLVPPSLTKVNQLLTLWMTLDDLGMTNVYLMLDFLLRSCWHLLTKGHITVIQKSKSQAIKSLTTV